MAKPRLCCRYEDQDMPPFASGIDPSPDGLYIAVTHLREICDYLASSGGECTIGRVPKPATLDTLIDQLGANGASKQAARLAFGRIYELLLHTGKRAPCAADCAFAKQGLALARIRLLLLLESHLPNASRHIYGQISMEILAGLESSNLDQLQREFWVVDRALEKSLGTSLRATLTDIAYLERPAENHRMRIGIPLSSTGFGPLVDEALDHWGRNWNHKHQVIPSVSEFEIILAQLPASLNTKSLLARHLGHRFTMVTYENEDAKRETFKKHVHDLTLIRQGLVFLLDQRVKPFLTFGNLAAICDGALRLLDGDITPTKFCATFTSANSYIGNKGRFHASEIARIYKEAGLRTVNMSQR